MLSLAVFIGYASASSIPPMPAAFPPMASFPNFPAAQANLMQAWASSAPNTRPLPDMNALSGFLGAAQAMQGAFAANLNAGFPQAFGGMLPPNASPVASIATGKAIANATVGKGKGKNGKAVGKGKAGKGKNATEVQEPPAPNCACWEKEMPAELTKSTCVTHLQTLKTCWNSNSGCGSFEFDSVIPCCDFLPGGQGFSMACQFENLNTLVPGGLAGLMTGSQLNQAWPTPTWPTVDVGKGKGKGKNANVPQIENPFENCGCENPPEYDDVTITTRAQCLAYVRESKECWAGCSFGPSFDSIAACCESLQGGSGNTIGCNPEAMRSTMFQAAGLDQNYYQTTLNAALQNANLGALQNPNAAAQIATGLQFANLLQPGIGLPQLGLFPGLGVQSAAGVQVGMDSGKGKGSPVASGKGSPVASGKGSEGKGKGNGSGR